jgi:hypothetical protein
MGCGGLSTRTSFQGLPQTLLRRQQPRTVANRELRDRADDGLALFGLRLVLTGLLRASAGLFLFPGASLFFSAGLF